MALRFWIGTGQTPPGHDDTTTRRLEMTLSSDDRGRITARVPQNVQDTLQYAADLVGSPLNQFIVQAALREAQRVIDRERVIELSSHDAAFLLKLLERPAKPNARLAEALRNYKARTLDADNSVFDWKPRSKALRLRKARPE
jgi:uncharacterized protein (DUF1778 family)